ncbi:hypothetical protein GCM10017784_35050 [Deinococcus indicus]|uniref:M15 family metallopeptidase n=1 Tax=Deinococcus indicus TaxID=223556 RepID=UPI00174890F3|nr:M15 family metallopeptidase [Deinococcus indicus]GHG37616.1 hypothetical protein GCM10017784_35050 [Deinococcus indicus]
MSTAQNRSMDALAQAYRDCIEPWLAAVRAAGLGVMVIETHRTRERQEYLFGQGRQGVPYARSGDVVTWTLDSLHRYGLAADVCPVVNGTISWNVADYQRLHRAAPPAKFGLELITNKSGGVLEWPHLQIAGGYAAAQRLGITRDSPQHSVWPRPSLAKPAPAPTPTGLTVTLIDASGNPVTLRDTRTVYGGVLITRTPDGVTLDKRGAQ